MKTVKERLIAFIKHLHMKVLPFEKLCDLSPGYVSSIRKGIGEGSLKKILTVYPELNRDWLLYGEGEMLKTSPDNIAVKKEDRSEEIPLIPIEAVAGLSLGFSSGVELKDCRKIICPIPGADFAIQISGNSMEPELMNGSYIYIKRINIKTFIPWGNTLVLDTDNGVVVKKVYPKENSDEFIVAKSVNPDYPPYEIKTSGIYGMYKVLGGSFINSTL